MFLLYKTFPAGSAAEQLLERKRCGDSVHAQVWVTVLQVGCAGTLLAAANPRGRRLQTVGGWSRRPRCRGVHSWRLL